MSRTKKVPVYFSDDEYDKIKKKADELGLKPSQFLRASGLSPYLFLDRSQLKNNNNVHK